jgi:hypothetical protein
MKLLGTGFAAAAAVVLAETPVAAQSLTIARVSAAQTICAFDHSCASLGTTTSASLQYYMQGTAAQVRTRTLSGLAGSTAAGKTGYEYQIDLTALPLNGGSECIVGMVFGFSTIDRIDYGGSGPTDLYVITSGSQGIIAPTAASLIAPGLVEVDFGEGVCAGQASDPFGLSSSQGSPASADIQLLEPGPIPILDVAGRVPSGSIGTSAPSPPTNLRVVIP